MQFTHNSYSQKVNHSGVKLGILFMLFTFYNTMIPKQPWRAFYNKDVETYDYQLFGIERA